MKRILLIVMVLICGASLAFADFEGEFGFYGGMGNAAGAGLSIQLGYMSSAGEEAEPGFRWGLLSDIGFGFRYGMSDEDQRFSYAYNGGTGIGSYNISPYEYNLGLLGEFYFLPFMGVAVGGGVTAGADSGNIVKDMFTPYLRAEIPFLFEWIKLGIGFDYIFWENDRLPAGVTMPPGYRVNLLMRFRGEVAALLMSLWAQ
jgi:hypothetical protein